MHARPDRALTLARLPRSFVARSLAIWQLCDELDVDTGPAQLNPSLTVVPLDAWYHYSFDHYDPRPGTVKFDKWCKWPVDYDAVAEVGNPRELIRSAVTMYELSQLHRAERSCAAHVRAK